MDLQQQAELAALVGAYCRQDGFTDTIIPFLRYYRMRERSGQMPVIHSMKEVVLVAVARNGFEGRSIRDP